MSYEITLPKDNTQCEEALKRLLSEGRSIRNVKQVDWWLVHYFMQGARSFSMVSYLTGEVTVDYTDTTSSDDMFRYDDMVTKFQSQLGRLLKIDLSPRVTKKNVGLEDLRKASTAQMVLSMQFPQQTVRHLKQILFPPLLKYGKMGLVTWLSDTEDVFIDVVPPWELLPIPPNPMDDNELGGLIRERKVPLDWVKGLTNVPGPRAEVWEQMDKIQVPAGQISQVLGSSVSAFKGAEFLAMETGRKAGSSGGKDQTMVDVVEFVEVWIQDSAGLLREYVVMAGNRIVKRIGYERGMRMHMPISTCEDIPTGGFWGRSFCSTLLPINIETEEVLGRLYSNLAELDAFGILCIPNGMGVPPLVMVGKDGLKRMNYEPNPLDPGIKPFTLSPANSGTAPIEGIKVGLGISDRLANQPTELMKGDAPGRVDSGQALGFLMESSNLPISPTAESIASAVSNCYRAALDLARSAWPSQKLVSVTLLDDSLAGVRMDPNSGMVTLEQSQIPSGEDVNVMVQSVFPRSVEQEKVELQEALKLQVIDMQEYQIQARIRALELPVGGEVEWQNYRRAMLENIVLFGDGREPGQVVVSKYDLHAIHLKVLQAFMARPEYYMADVKVRSQFDLHYEAHMTGMGVFPDQMPHPEEAAGEADMMQKLQESMMAGQAGQGMEQSMPQGAMPPEGQEDIETQT
jgi:hypothetical protein